MSQQNIKGSSNKSIGEFLDVKKRKWNAVLFRFAANRLQGTACGEMLTFNSAKPTTVLGLALYRSASVIWFFFDLTNAKVWAVENKASQEPAC